MAAAMPLQLRTGSTLSLDAMLLSIPAALGMHRSQLAVFLSGIRQVNSIRQSGLQGPSARLLRDTPGLFAEAPGGTNARL